MCGVYKVLVSTKLEIDYSAIISLVFECGSFKLEKNVFLLYSLIKTRRLLYWSYQVWTEIGKTEVQRS